MTPIKIEIKVGSTGTPLNVRYRFYEKIPGVGWVAAGDEELSNVDDFETDIAAEAASSFAGNEPAA